MDYKSLGLVLGLEIHQQLDTGKLFCRCNTQLSEGEPDFIIKRRIRPVPGEDGKIDVTARDEFLKGKYVIYEGFKESSCLVETDSEPPHEIDQDALNTGLQICKMFECKIPPAVQIMRKTIIDGSNTSGFQRTGLIGVNGELEVLGSKIRIKLISIEEDSARPIKEEVDHTVYRLDRLGFPLIEVVTEPDIKTPEECMECAQKIGMILRSTGKVKRGLGTIRQDINVSIREGNRVEIKGAQDLKMIPKIIELEVLRQKELVEIKKQLENVKEFKTREFIDLSSVLKNCKSKVIKGEVWGFGCPGMIGIFGKEIGPNKRFGTECSGRAKVKARVKGIIHSDELPNYGVTEKDVLNIRSELNLDESDAFVLVCAKKERAHRALNAVFERIKEARLEIPKEVRNVNKDGTTSFMRMLPGAARMYPETDVSLIYPNIDEIELPELIDDKIGRFMREYKLSSDLARAICRGYYAVLFEEILKKNKNLKASFVAEVLTGTLRSLKRDYEVDIERFSDEDFALVFDLINKGKISKDVVIDVLIDVFKKQFDVNKYKGISKKEIEKEIKEIITKNKDAPFSALMGLCMKKLHGKATGKEVSEILKREIKR